MTDARRDEYGRYSVKIGRSSVVLPAWTAYSYQRINGAPLPDVLTYQAAADFWRAIIAAAGMADDAIFPPMVTEKDARRMVVSAGPGRDLFVKAANALFRDNDKGRGLWRDDLDRWQAEQDAATAAGRLAAGEYPGQFSFGDINL